MALNLIKKWFIKRTLLSDKDDTGITKSSALDLDAYIQYRIDNTSGVRPYKVYTALLTQTGTDAPVATVLGNTLGGTVVWSYVDVGQYNATYTGVGNGKVLISHGALMGVFSCGWDKITDDILLLTTSSLDSVNPSYLENAILNNALIEIRVYP